MFRKTYADVFKGDQRWQGLNVPTGETFAWEKNSTYVKNPPYFENMTVTPKPVEEIGGARVLAILGHSITTDHISPAGSIKKDSPAGKYLIEHGVKPGRLQLVRFASRQPRSDDARHVRQYAPAQQDGARKEGGFTRHYPGKEEMTIFDASEHYRAEGVPLVILAGKEYGSGSSRDWAAKGPRLLGVRAVIAESFERIHRSNLVGMGILPLQFL